MNPSSANFDSEANIASSNCDENEQFDTSLKHLPLGGIYQTCKGSNDICKSEIISNPATGDTSCPKGYLAVQLIPEQAQKCYQECQKNGWLENQICTDVCTMIKTFWCSLDPTLIESAQPDQENGFLFGGLYTDKEVNPLTKQFQCPEYYWPIDVGRHIRLCLSNDHEMGIKNSMLFGGFFSCYSGNPLVSIINRNKTRSIKNKRNTINTNNNQSSLQNLFNIQTQMETGRSANLQQSSLARSSYEVTDYSSLFSTVWPKQCPPGYTSHLAAIENVCQVMK